MCFNTHRPTPLPRPDADGRITIYRGMGTQSLPPERAISWSSHPEMHSGLPIVLGRGPALQ